MVEWEEGIEDGRLGRVWVVGRDAAVDGDLWRCCGGILHLPTTNLLLLVLVAHIEVLVDGWLIRCYEVLGGFLDLIRKWLHINEVAVE